MPGRNPNIALTNCITGSESLGAFVGRSRRTPFGWPVVPENRAWQRRATHLGQAQPDSPRGGIVGLPAPRGFVRPVISSRSSCGHFAAAASDGRRAAELNSMRDFELVRM